MTDDDDDDDVDDNDDDDDNYDDVDDDDGFHITSIELIANQFQGTIIFSLWACFAKKCNWR